MAEDRMLSDEILLGIINSKSGGGGGGGTSNYNDLSNKPQIGGVTLSGNKSASDLGLVAAENGKGLSTNDYTDADKAIVGGVTAALAGKQNVLTAGNNIKIDNNTISVNRWAAPAGKVVYTVITSDENYGQNVHVQRHTLGGGFIDDRTFLCEMYKTVNVDNLISIYNPYASFTITLLKNSDEHQSGYSYTVNPITTPTSNSFTFMMEQEENANDLIIRSELDAKADLTDLAPAFSAATSYAVGQYVSYDGNIYKCTSAHSAGAWVAGDFTLVAVGSELESKQDKTDNNLQTTDKTVVGAINEHEGDISSLMSGLTNLDVALSVPEGTGKNVIPMTLAAIKAANTVGTWSGNVYTINDFTFTVQTDSDGNVSGISANGTVPSNLWGLPFYLPSTSVKDGKSYILTGCPNGGSSSTYTLYTTDDSDNNISDYGNGITYTANFTGNAYVRIAIYRGATVNNIVFHPMIRPATITDPTFAPYIPSVESRIEAVENGIARIVCTEIVYDDSANLFTLPSGVPKPKDGAQIMVCGRNRSTGAIYALWFDNSASGFKIGKILEGSAPADGISISVQYIA